MEKNNRVEIRVDERCKEKLFKDAEKAGLTASAYLRELIYDKTPKTREDYQLVKDLIYEIDRIGNNINQIAKFFNSGYFNEGEKKELFELMHRLTYEMEKIIRKDEKHDL